MLSSGLHNSDAKLSRARCSQHMHLPLTVTLETSKGETMQAVGVHDGILSVRPGQAASTNLCQINDNMPRRCDYATADRQVCWAASCAASRCH